MATETEWTPEQGIITMQGDDTPAGLKKSPFRDESGPGIVHLTVPLDGGTVYTREMSDAAYAEYLRRSKSLATQTRALMAIEDRAKAAAARGDSALAKRLRDGAEVEANAALKVESELGQWLMSECVVAWSYARPFTPESLAQLSGAAQSQILTAVLQGSNLGRDTDFLAAGS